MVTLSINDIFERDQTAIDEWLHNKISRDQAREIQKECVKLIVAAYEEKKIITADEHMHAAFVFQHGATAWHYKVAHELALKAVSMGLMKAKWITAASEDRYLVPVAKT